MTVALPSASLSLDIAAYLDIAQTRHARPRVDITVADRAWRPQLEDRQRYWVASVAAPALKILRAQRGDDACKAFCALGTGEILEAAFARLDLEEAGRNALAIEDSLRSYQLDAAAAWSVHCKGRRIGHTVAALLSEPKR